MHSRRRKVRQGYKTEVFLCSHFSSSVFDPLSFPIAPPPPGLLAFYWHFVGQTKGLYAALFATGMAVALIDTLVPVFIGRLVRVMEATGRATALQEAMPMLVGMVLLISVGRPLAILIDSLIRHNAVVPGVPSLVRWQSHWHVIRQSWSLFQNDFAGRIANRVMNTSEAVRECVVSSIHAVWYISVYGISTLVLMSGADWRLAMPTALWLIAYVIFLQYFVPRMRDLSKISSERHSAVMGRAFENIGVVQEGMETIAVPHAIHDTVTARNLDTARVRGEIRIERLTFTYGRDDGRKVLDSLDCIIRPGERVGLVGSSGAGKSTLINLLLRFYEIETGRILIDGQDIRELTQESLRRAIGVVAQDTSLLHRSIAENIAYGCAGATQAQIEFAAQRAQAHEFIMRQRDWKGRVGYEAQVGERGVKLSAGQRQRIAIARVVLKNAPILVLEEATSALDSEVELAIQDQLLRLMEGKMVIAIAHRLSTIACLDRLLVLNEGRITEEGTHDELLRLGGQYAMLWRHQSGGFL